MSAERDGAGDATGPAVVPTRRRYDSEVRRQQVADTRERILAAGVHLAHGTPRWDWRDLTVRAVAREAGVNERTVYRHFTNERELHDAVMHRLESESGAPLAGLDLSSFPDLTSRVFDYMASFVPKVPRMDDQAFIEVHQRRREALLGAVAEMAEDWSEEDQRTVAALLDVLWSLATYDRLTNAWGLDAGQASKAVTATARLVVEAVANGRRVWDQD